MKHTLLSSRITWMTNPRFELAGLLMVLLATPIWILIAVEAYLSPGFGSGPGRYVVAPFVLCGMTAAIHYLVRPLRNAWPLSALLAGIGALTVLLLASG